MVNTLLIKFSTFFSVNMDLPSFINFKIDYGILILGGFEMVKNHFANFSLLSIKVDKKYIGGALSNLDTFCFASGVIVGAHKIDFWFIGLDTTLDWNLITWPCILPMVIMQYWIPFRVWLLVVSMWD